MNLLIEQANQVLQGKIRKTPLEYSSLLSKQLGKPIFLKLECLQLTGSFKIRGGFFSLATLNEDQRKKGVATCSAGNHGLALGFAARELNIPCTVFVPKSVDQAKYEKIVDLGVNVKKSEFIGYDDTYEWAIQEAKKLDVPLVSPFDDENIMAANGGTLALEVLEQAPDAVQFVMPVGGGGLSAGFSWLMKDRKSHSKMTLCQLADSPGLELSLKEGKPKTYMPPIETLAGGLEGGLGVKCFEYLKTRVDEIASIKEKELRGAMLWFLKHHQYVIEASSAAALASCLYGHVKPIGPTVIVLSGRNVSYSTLNLLMNEFHEGSF